MRNTVIICFVALLSIAAVTLPWKQKFDAVYHLDENENFKFIPPPHIPERQTWATQNRLNSGNFHPKWQMGLRWDGTIRNWSLSPIVRLESIFDDCRGDIDPPTFGLEGPEPLKEIIIMGDDWIMRTSASEDQRIAGLEAALQKRLKRSIRFVKKSEEHHVIVATGKFELHPLPNSANAVWFDTRPYDKSSGAGTSTLPKLLRRLGEYSKVYIVDETEPYRARIGWRQPPSMREDADIPDPTALFRSVAAQTSLTFQRERRKVGVWYVEDQEKR